MLSTADPDTTSTTLTGTFVLLRAGNLRLLLPQQEVSAADYIELAPQPTDQAGVFTHGEGDAARPIVALSAKMRPLAAFPSDRFLLASLATEAGDMAMAWDEVRVLMEAEIKCQALPESMRVPGAPIESYVHLDGEIALYTSADRVMAFAFDSRG